MLQQSDLEIGADQDVEPVAELIGLHAIQAWRQRVQSPPEILRTVKGSAHRGKLTPPLLRERTAAGHPVLPEQRLALVHSHGRRLAERPGKPLMALVRQTLFVKGMAPLMGRRQKTGQGLTLHHPGGDAVVGRPQGDGKGMGRTRHAGDRGITPPAVEQRVAQLLLGCLRQIPAGGAGTGARGGCGHQVWQCLSQGSKHLLQPLEAEVWLKRLGQGLPAGPGLGQLTGLFLAQLDQALQGWRELREVRGRPRLLPLVVAACFGGCQGSHQSGIKRLLAAQILLQQIEVATPRTTVIGLCLLVPLLSRRLHEVGVLRGALPGMQLGRQQ